MQSSIYICCIQRCRPNRQSAIRQLSDRVAMVLVTRPTALLWPISACKEEILGRGHAPRTLRRAPCFEMAPLYESASSARMKEQWSSHILPWLRINTCTRTGNRVLTGFPAGMEANPCVAIHRYGTLALSRLDAAYALQSNHAKAVGLSNRADVQQTEDQRVQWRRGNSIGISMVCIHLVEGYVAIGL